jgi:hypothetical protein
MTYKPGRNPDFQSIKLSVKINEKFTSYEAIQNILKFTLTLSNVSSHTYSAINDINLKSVKIFDTNTELYKTKTINKYIPKDDSNYKNYTYIITLEYDDFALINNEEIFHEEIGFVIVINDKYILTYNSIFDITNLNINPDNENYEIQGTAAFKIGPIIKEFPIFVNYGNIQTNRKLSIKNQQIFSDNTLLYQDVKFVNHEFSPNSYYLKKNNQYIGFTNSFILEESITDKSILIKNDNVLIINENKPLIVPSLRINEIVDLIDSLTIHWVNENNKTLIESNVVRTEAMAYHGDQLIEYTYDNRIKGYLKINIDYNQKRTPDTVFKTHDGNVSYGLLMYGIDCEKLRNYVNATNFTISAWQFTIYLHGLVMEETQFADHGMLSDYNAGDPSSEILYLASSANPINSKITDETTLYTMTYTMLRNEETNWSKVHNNEHKAYAILQVLVLTDEDNNHITFDLKNMPDDIFKSLDENYLNSDKSQILRNWNLLKNVYPSIHPMPMSDLYTYENESYCLDSNEYLNSVRKDTGNCVQRSNETWGQFFENSTLIIANESYSEINQETDKIEINGSYLASVGGNLGLRSKNNGNVLKKTEA